MRLVCPRCGAQYEIDAAAIPAAGRDVECSACEHVWRARPVAAGAEPFDPTARPRLSRPLSESVIEILRQEAARELEVRAAERRSQRLAEAGPDAAPPVHGDTAEAPEPATQPAAPVPAGTVSAGPAGFRPPSPSPSPSPDDTLLPGDAPEPEPEGEDAAPMTPPVAAPAAPSMAPPMAAPTAVSAMVPATIPARPAVPVVSPAQARRRRYDAGFHLAVVLSLITLALYALAPRLADQQPIGPVLVEWRGKVDQARDRLADHGDAAIAWLRSVIDGPPSD